MVASYGKDAWFESSHRQFLLITYQLYWIDCIYCMEKMKINKKEAGNDSIFKNSLLNNLFTLYLQRTGAWSSATGKTATAATRPTTATTTATAATAATAATTTTAAATTTTTTAASTTAEDVRVRPVPRPQRDVRQRPDASRSIAAESARNDHDSNPDPEGGVDDAGPVQRSQPVQDPVAARKRRWSSLREWKTVQVNNIFFLIMLNSVAYCLLIKIK